MIKTRVQQVAHPTLAAVGNAIAGGNAVELAEVAGISYAAAQYIIAAQQHGADKKTVSDMVSQAQATSGGAMPPDDGDKDGIKKKNDYTDKKNKKVNSTEKGDIVRTPDSHPQDFDILKQRNGTFYKNKYTGEIWQESRTTHTGKQGEWKVGIGKKEPTPTRKITVDKQTGKVLKHD